MAKIHDKFVIELAEVIKGYGNNPDVDEPFHLSEFYRFYELPEIAVDREHFAKMIPLDEETEKRKSKIGLICLRCKTPYEYTWDAFGQMSYTNYSYCENCLREGLRLLREKDNGNSV